MLHSCRLPVTNGDKELVERSSETSWWSNFLERVSDALNSTTSKPNSFVTRWAVVVLPEKSRTDEK